MRQKRSFITSIISATCPRCREGKMFPHPLYSWKFMTMNTKCPCCARSFILEPGFFLGSAYFSYLINAILLLAIGYTLYYSGTKITVAAMIASILIVVFGLLPVTLRLSKSAWIHIFIRYEGPCSEIPKQ
jgi:uncharacterized protein (DUF983 family)